MTYNNFDIENIENNIATINGRIDHLQKKLEDAPREKVKEFKEALDKLEEKRDQFVTKTQMFKETTENVYTDLQTGVRLAWEDINMAVDSVKERFEKEDEQKKNLTTEVS